MKITDTISSIKIGAVCIGTILAAAFFSTITSCSAKGTTGGAAVTGAQAEQFISEVSSSALGRMDPIVIAFTKEMVCEPEQGITLRPAQKGSWQRRNEFTAVFTPEKPYKAGSRITLTADCARLLGTGSSTDTCTRDFLVSTPSYTVTLDEFLMDSSDRSFSLSGSFTTDIPAGTSVLQKSLSVTYGGKLLAGKLPVEWQGNESDTTRRFTIRGITQHRTYRMLTVSWNGRALGVTGSQDKLLAGRQEYLIPSEQDFSIIDINTSKPNTILVSFSRPLDTAQDIPGFISTRTRSGGTAKINSTVRGNVLTLYNDGNWDDITELTVQDGIKSTDGILLAAASSVTLNEHWDLPAVEFANSGVILPSSQGTVLPVRTRNLSGLLVQAYAIYDRTINQFLQVNDLDGNEELYRVGEPVWTKNISFDWNDSMQNKFITRGLELSELAKKYPGGMFQIRVTFRKKNVKYICRSGHRDFSELPMPDDMIEPERRPQERSSWDYWDNMNWRERDSYWSYDDDPCHPAFYTPYFNSSCLIKRNVLITDIGLMAKQTSDGDLYVTATDLKTAKPLSGADLTLWNFVGTPVATTVADSQGGAVFTAKPGTSPYVVTASYNKQQSYLKLSEGTGLSISHFETGGEKSVDGVKGYIYGERGVWRPGDNIYLTFVLQDLKKTLPSDIPVSFQLQDPMGRVTESRTLRNNVNGFYPITIKTNAGAPTGVWQSQVKIGGKTWTQPLRIETVVPNRLSVKLETQQEYLVPRNNTLKLSGAWLHGAPVPEYTADVSVSFSRAATGFDGYSEYSFTNPRNSLESSRELIWDGYLDKNSQADFNVDLHAGSNLPGKLKANFLSRIFEPSGAFSTESKSFNYSPYTRYAGLKLPKGDKERGMLLTDVDHTADVVLLTTDGKPVPDATLSYAVHKLEWKWWWEKDALTDATYVSYRSESLVTEGTVHIKDGKGAFNFMVKYPSWGRYLVTVTDGSSGHSTGKIVYIDWPGWAGRAQESGSGSASMITLINDKQKYTPGETASISFPSGKGGRALVTVEKNGRILSQSWLETRQGTTVFTMPVTAQMAPNAYVHVTMLQPHMQTANSLPIRLYGVVPVTVDDPGTRLKPVISAPAQFEPNKTAAISVSEAQGRPMTYTVAVVDEGLLGLTGYHAPSLHSAFYKKEASQLTSWDIYRYVMSAYSGKLETLLAIGGSEEITDDRERSSNRFTPVVKYFGPYTLSRGETKTTEFLMPEYIGAVRAVVIAGYNGAYGEAEKSVPVKSDLIVQASLPRTLGTGETVTVPLTVFNGTAAAQNITVSLGIEGAAANAEGSKSTRIISVPAQDSRDVFFNITTQRNGNAVFTAKASMKGYADAVSHTTVPVQSRGIPVTYRTNFSVKPGETADVSVQSPSEPATITSTMELSVLPSLNLTERLQYLITYPHGCIEQITSGGFPQLYVPGFITLTPEQTDTIKKNVKSVIERYPGYQTESGGFSYWPGSTTPHAWGSCYGAHFLLEAKRYGYDVPSSLLTPLLNWLSKSAADWSSSSNSGDDSSDTQAYKLFVLASAGRADIAAMNRLMDILQNSRSSSDQPIASATFMLASAYSVSGRADTARTLLKGTRIRREAYRRTGGNFASTARDQALYLFTVTKTGDMDTAGKLAKRLAENLVSDTWYSTQETAWALLSLLPYYKEQQAGTCAYTVTAEGRTQSGTITNGAVQEKLAAGTGSVQKASVTNTGRTILYGTFSASGMSIAGTEQEQHDNLRLDVTYYDNDDYRISRNSLEPGDTFKIRIRVTNLSYETIHNIALTVPIPTCWEITNERLSSDVYDEYHGDSSENRFTYQDIRDDAVYTYFDLDERDDKVFTLSGTVVYTADSYFIPAIHAQAMYDASCSAVYPGQQASSWKNDK